MSSQQVAVVAAACAGLVVAIVVAGVMVRRMRASRRGPRVGPSPGPANEPRPGTVGPLVGDVAVVRTHFRSGGGYVEAGGVVLWADAADRLGALSPGVAVTVTAVEGTDDVPTCRVEPRRTEVPAAALGGPA